MTGFELSVHGKKIIAAIEKGVMTVIATRVIEDQRDSINLDINGLDTSGTEHHVSVTWFNAELNVGDEFTVRIVDIAEASKPTYIREKTAEFNKEMKLNSYYSLKKQLEEEGLLQRK